MSVISLDTLRKMVAKDFPVIENDIDAVSKEASNIPYLLGKYATILHDEKNMLRVYEKQKQSMYVDLYEYYMGRRNPRQDENRFDFKITIKEVDIYILADDKYIPLLDQYTKQKNLVEYLEYLTKHFQFARNQALIVKKDMLKLQLGG